MAMQMRGGNTKALGLLKRQLEQSDPAPTA
jgi:hypothetical protein